MPAESEIIQRLRKRESRDPRVIVGIGDDAAVLRCAAGDSLITCCDLSVEDVHFKRDWAPLDVLGRKALAVTVSDVAAMGGTPLFAMLSVALPAGLSKADLDLFFDGVFDAAEEFGLTIVGGDTSSSPGPLFIDTSVIGQCSSGRPITRKGARSGDSIYVTGTLGGSHAGLTLLKKGLRVEDFESRAFSAEDAGREAIVKHLVPEPRIQAGKRLAEAGLPTAMIDVSDGLSTDLSHLLEENSCGAIIQAGRLPIAGCLPQLSTWNIDPLEAALHGGEEYELLFTALPGSEPRIAELAAEIALPITQIGEIVAEPSIRLVQGGAARIIVPSGYEHQI